jgi:hypothetical protein
MLPVPFPFPLRALRLCVHALLRIVPYPQSEGSYRAWVRSVFPIITWRTHECVKYQDIFYTRSHDILYTALWGRGFWFFI